MTKAGKGNKTVSVIMPEETHELLVRWAKSKDWSISQAAKNLISKGLQQEMNEGKLTNSEERTQ
jgi:hypothetical protein